MPLALTYSFGPVVLADFGYCIKQPQKNKFNFLRSQFVRWETCELSATIADREEVNKDTAKKMEVNITF